MLIEDLHLFLRVAARGSLAQAAQDLGITPETATARLNRLETEVGQRLCHRGTREVTLSEAGHLFQPYAASAVASAESGASAASDAAAASGTLRVTAPAAFGRLYLVPALGEFLAAHPELAIDLRLHDAGTDPAAAAVDVAIRDGARADDSLAAERLAPDRRLLVAAPSYLARRGTPESLADLAQHDGVILGEADRWRFRLPDGIHAVRMRGRVRTDTGDAVRAAAIQGLGIARTSTWNARKALLSGALVPVLSWVPLADKSALWAVYPRQRAVPARARAFIDFFATRFGDPPSWDRGLERVLPPARRAKGS